MKEEILPKDFLMLHISKEISAYLYAKEIAFEGFKLVQKSILRSENWGNEVLGLMIVPLAYQNFLKINFALRPKINF